MHRSITVGLIGCFMLACGNLPHLHQNANISHDPASAHAQADTNRDGYVDMAEFHQRITDVYFHGDSDKDGYLVVAEINKIVVFQKDWTEVDSNADGKISLHEFVRDRIIGFQRADADADGLLSKQEVIDAFGGSQP